MTRVCLIGEEDVDLRGELLARETSRDALAAYALASPWENTIAVTTVSVGAAVSLLNDLNWYLVRFVADAILFEPSVSETEWFSRGVATEIRDQRIDPDETGSLLKIYGVENGRLVEPMYTRRAGDQPPTYDLRDVTDTLVVRITEAEFG